MCHQNAYLLYFYLNIFVGKMLTWKHLWEDCLNRIVYHKECVVEAVKC